MHKQEVANKKLSYGWHTVRRV